MQSCTTIIVLPDSWHTGLSDRSVSFSFTTLSPVGMYSELKCVSGLAVVDDRRNGRPFSAKSLCLDLHTCSKKVHNLIPDLSKQGPGKSSSAKDRARLPPDADSMVPWCILGVVKIQVGFLKYLWIEHVRVEAAWRAEHAVRGHAVCQFVRCQAHVRSSRPTRCTTRVLVLEYIEQL